MRAPLGALTRSDGRSFGPALLQLQSLNVQDFSENFHGVRFSSRHCAKRAGGQLLRRRFSSLIGSLTRVAAAPRWSVRRHFWRVACEIRSTYSGLLAKAGSS